ncbi:hypothetical protein [Dyella sp.]|uniref:hypothetical protein n=1 Tax=Dyella sp. TaxID=1869338 RepID=UPI002ED42747
MKRVLTALVSTLIAAGAMAQSASKAPLNLKLPNDMPPSSVPASSSTAPKPASSSTTANTAPSASSNSTRPKDAPGVYYGDTSGRIYHDEDRVVAERQDCDDATYNNTQVHGSVGMGVVSGSHFGGNYQTGDISFSKRTGSCDHPTGGVSVNIGVGQFHGH